MRAALYPMGVPLILNPAGIAAAIIFSAEASTVGGLDYLSSSSASSSPSPSWTCWSVARPTGRGTDLPERRFIVLEQVLGVLLSAVAVQLIVIGLGQLGIIGLVR